MYQSWADLSSADRHMLRLFMERQADYMRGRTLDFGCGKQPYRDIVEAAGADYHPYDRPNFPDSHVKEPVGDDKPLEWAWDTIICNEVISLVVAPLATLRSFRQQLTADGHVILTYKAAWINYHRLDRWRFTDKGMEDLVRTAGLHLVVHEPLLTVNLAPDYPLVMGYGVVALAD